MADVVSTPPIAETLRARAFDAVALSVRSVSKIDRNGALALDDVDLSLVPGAVTAILGGARCGKSTLLRIIAGVERATSGVVRVARDEITGPHPDVSLLAGEQRLPPWLSVAENVARGLGSVASEAGEALTANLLAHLGLRDDAHRPSTELSDGQQRLAAAARALVAGPRILLLDEPFSTLDGATRQVLHARLLSLCKMRRTAIVIATRDVDEAVALADRIIVMRPNPGRIVAVIDNAAAGDGRSRDLERVRRLAIEALESAMRPAPVDHQRLLVAAETAR